jgi:hypothetical protein
VLCAERAMPPPTFGLAHSARAGAQCVTPLAAHAQPCSSARAGPLPGGARRLLAVGEGRVPPHKGRAAGALRALEDLLQPLVVPRLPPLPHVSAPRSPAPKAADSWGYLQFAAPERR